MIESERFGEKLRQLRESMAMTQSEFGQFLGNRNYQTIGRWETGTGEIRWSTVVEICAYCKVTPNYFSGHSSADMVQENHKMKAALESIGRIALVNRQ